VEDRWKIVPTMQTRARALKPKTETAKTVKKTKEAKPKDSTPKESKSVKWSIGDKITPIVLKNENDEEVDLLKEAQDNGLVIFFYPKANTPGMSR
jgi:hypothetical protein